MRQKWFLLGLALLLTLSTVIGLQELDVVEANTGEELKDKMNELEQKRDELKEESGKTEEELESVENDIDQINSDMKLLDEEMAITNDNIAKKQEEIEETNEQINDLKEEINGLEETIAERDDLLKDRVRHMYKSGGAVDYIEVILGAKSFGDLIERVMAVNTIAQQDRHILDQHVEDKESVELAKENLEQVLETLELQMNELEDLKDELDSQLEEKVVLINKLEEQQGELLEEIVSIEEEESIIKAQEDALAQELKRWEDEQRRLEEERRKAEEEAKRQAELEKGQDSGNASTGKLHRPANGRITSDYGWRIHPITGKNNFHGGVDFGRYSGRGIYAAANGTVSVVGRLGTYGNIVVLTHVVDGETLHTLYAHLASADVQVGQQVNRGQRIATMGTTGSSTGVHLHFEVRTGMGWNNSKRQNPMNYLN